MLQSFSKKKLANAAYGAFMQAFEKLVVKGTCEKLSLTPADFSGFQSKLMEFLDLNREGGQQDLTKRLNELDARRDQLLSYFFTRINLDLVAPKEAVRKAAESLWTFRKQYLGIQGKGLREESFLINGLLLDAEKEPFKAAVGTLGLKDTLEELKKVNTDFESLLSQRAEVELATNPLPAKKLREGLDAFYDASTRRIDAVNLLTPTPETESFVASLNKLIKDTNESRKLHKAQLGLWTEEGGREDEEEAPKTSTTEGE